jgi:hypothetical protein
LQKEKVSDDEFIQQLNATVPLVGLIEVLRLENWPNRTANGLYKRIQTLHGILTKPDGARKGIYTSEENRIVDRQIKLFLKVLSFVKKSG